jgi:hypothetical protein
MRTDIRFGDWQRPPSFGELGVKCVQDATCLGDAVLVLAVPERIAWSAAARSGA